MLAGVLPSLDAALDAIAQLASSREEPLPVVIDELVGRIAAPAQRQCQALSLGSLVSWMEEQTLSERGPLHNRRTMRLLLDPLTDREAVLFYPNYGPEDRIAA
jgi:hypothetical protein